MRHLTLALTVVLATACAPPRSAPPTPAPEEPVRDALAEGLIGPNAESTERSGPCADSRYRELRELDVDEMTERQYETYQRLDQACTDHRLERARMASEMRRAAAQRQTQQRAIGAYEEYARWALIISAATIVATFLW